MGPTGQKLFICLACTIAAKVFQIAEQACCTYFAFELFVRFMAFEQKRNFLKDHFFLFDAALVALMVLETWVMTAVALLTTQAGSAQTSLGNSSGCAFMWFY